MLMKVFFCHSIRISNKFVTIKSLNYKSFLVLLIFIVRLKFQENKFLNSLCDKFLKESKNINLYLKKQTISEL